jgi:hypothetical protein
MCVSLMCSNVTPLRSGGGLRLLLPGLGGDLRSGGGLRLLLLRGCPLNISMFQG